MAIASIARAWPRLPYRQHRDDARGRRFPGQGAGRQGNVPGSTPDLIRVAVIGGGLAGLTATYELERRARLDFLPLEIRLYEAEERFGGAIRSERVLDYLLEHGPASFSTTDDGVLRLAVELGLQRELVPAHVERGVSIRWQGAWHAMPPGLSRCTDNGRRALLRSTLLSSRGKLRVALESQIPARRRNSHETAAGFVTRRFGRQMLERVGEPLLASQHFGGPAELNAHYVLSELVQLERSDGCVRKGLRRLQQRDEERFGIAKKILRSPQASFREGMQMLIDAMTAAVQRGDTGALQHGQRVTGIRPAGDPLGSAAYALEIEGGEPWVAEVCVLAAPARVSARLVRDFAPEVADGLDAIPHASSLAVYLGFDNAASTRLPEAMNCLIPRAEGRVALSCALVHQEFDFRTPPGAALVRVQMGGSRHPALIDWDDDTAVRAARKEVAELFDVRAEPSLARVVRRPRAHPQHLVDHRKRLNALERELSFHSGLLLTGAALHGSSVCQVIDGGRATAATVADMARSLLA